MSLSLFNMTDKQIVFSVSSFVSETDVTEVKNTSTFRDFCIADWPAHRRQCVTGGFLSFEVTEMWIVQKGAAAQYQENNPDTLCFQ